MRNRLITIFGGTGFIGRHVVRRLAVRHARIRVVSRNWARTGACCSRWARSARSSAARSTSAARRR